MVAPIPNNHKRRYAGQKQQHTGMYLQYEGKTAADQILATHPGQYMSKPTHQIHPNRLYHDDNLPVLCALARDNSVRSHVKLVYIDPPFATNAHFQSRRQRLAYDDNLVGAAYVEALRQRIIFIHHLLAHDGSLYLHLDGRMVFHMRVVLDEVFGTGRFQGFITRRKCHPKNYTRNTYGNVSDYILFYTKGRDYIWNRPLEHWDDARVAKEYPCVDGDGRRYKKVPVHAPGVRNGETGKKWRGKLPPPGKHWQYTPEKLDEMDARGDIYWSPTGNPRRKVFLEDSKGIPIQDIWLDMVDSSNQNARITGYPTEKNPSLLRRIIEASSNPGDLVMDCYAGSGTTLEVASNLNRRWIGIDNSDEAIRTMLDRCENGTARMGDFVNVQQQSSLFMHNRIQNFTLFLPVRSGRTNS